MVRATGAVDSSLNDLVRELAQDPREHTSLEKCGLSPREAVLGVIVLVRAGRRDARSRALRRLGEPESESVAPDNLAFYRAHRDRILSMLEEFVEER